MNSNPKPRVTGTTHSLPFEKLSAEDFERLTLWLAAREGFTDAQHLGETGSEQGRDILAWKEGRRFAFQCKRVKALSAAEGVAEIRKLQGLETDEQPHEVIFVLPNRAPGCDTQGDLEGLGGRGDLPFLGGKRARRTG